MCCTPGARVEFHVLLDLRLLQAVRRLVDGHLHVLVVVRDHHRAQCRVLRRDVLVVDRPQAVEAEDVLVELHHVFHLAVRLIADNVIDEQQPRRLRFAARLRRRVAREERSFVAVALHERVRHVAVGMNPRHDDLAALVFQRARLEPILGTVLRRVLPRLGCIVHRKRDVDRAVAMLLQQVVERRSLRVRSVEDEVDVILSQDIARRLTVSLLQPAVSHQVEAEDLLIINSRLLGISDRKRDVVESEQLEGRFH